MSNLTVLNFGTNQVHTIIDEKGEAWFLANDVCNILGYANPRRTIDLHCKTPGVTKRYMGVVTGKKADGSDATQQVEMTYINEPNLYRLIIKSKKPEAEVFEIWVMEEVLPTIRKTGRYKAPIPNSPYGQQCTVFNSLPEGRYYVLSQKGETIIRKIDGCSIVDGMKVDLVRKDLRKASELLIELNRRLNVLNGEESEKLLEAPLNIGFFEPCPT